MKKTKWLVIVCVVMSAGIADAQAQMIPWEDRGYLSVNFGIQPQSRDFTEVSAPEIYGDPATITVPHTIGSGAFPDFAFGYRSVGEPRRARRVLVFQQDGVADARGTDSASGGRRRIEDRFGEHRRSLAQ